MFLCQARPSLPTMGFVPPRVVGRTCGFSSRKSSTWGFRGWENLPLILRELWASGVWCLGCVGEPVAAGRGQPRPLQPPLTVLPAAAAGTSEHEKLCRARDQCRDILKYVNEAVKRAENRHRLEGYQKRLDATSLERTSNPLAAEFKVTPAPGGAGGLGGAAWPTLTPLGFCRAWTSRPDA